MEHLFSYGTLQLEAVQLANFGRRLTGYSDTLVGFAAASIALADPTTVSLSGMSTFLIACHTGHPADTIVGTVYELTPAELVRADAYECEPYVRVAVRLGSGRRAWAYVHADHMPPRVVDPYRE
jgi:hypothetical protein